MKVSELTGALLDLWVARADGKCYTVRPGVWGMACINGFGRLSITKNSWDGAKYFEPSKNWAHGGPIIERERMSFATIGTGPRGANGHPPIVAIPEAAGRAMEGDTHLIAAMRAYVASKFGETVPDDTSKETQA